jgi:hypothetical protein
MPILKYWERRMILTNKDYTNIKSLIKFAVNFDRGKLRWNELHFALGYLLEPELLTKLPES